MADAERQLAVEGAQRVRVAACALTAGLFFFGGQLWVAVIGAKEPTVGVLQGLYPAFHGMAAAWSIRARSTSSSWSPTSTR